MQRDQPGRRPLFPQHIKIPRRGGRAAVPMGDRQLSAATVTKYGLGFAPQGWDNLRSYLRKGYTDEQTPWRRSSPAGGTGNRSTTPSATGWSSSTIHLRKNVIGFGGRVMDDSKPKYLNSPDTPVFKKSLQPPVRHELRQEYRPMAPSSSPRGIWTSSRSTRRALTTPSRPWAPR